MSFIKRELARIGTALRDPGHAGRYAELYAAQQALSWASDPDAFRSPYDMLMGNRTMPTADIPAGSEDCSVHPRPQPSSDTYCHDG